MAPEKDEQGIFDGVEMGVGTWAWGDRMFWGYRQGYAEEEIQAAFEASIQGGTTLFDTAETYAQGQSEKFLGRFIQTIDQKVQVATKFMPFPWRLTGKALLRALKASLNRLGLKRVDLYQVHFPLPPVKVETWMEAMVESSQMGLIEAVGVSNFNLEQTQRAYDALQREGLRLASNQLEYHLLNRKIEQNGLMKRCAELGIKVIAYSPLAQGILTGKYTLEHPTRGFRARKYNPRMLEKILPLVQLQKKIGADHGGKNAAQVALNWCICKDTIPIPGAKNYQQAEQNAGATGWRLTEAEVALLDTTSDQVLRGN